MFTALLKDICDWHDQQEAGEAERRARAIQLAKQSGREIAKLEFMAAEARRRPDETLAEAVDRTRRERTKWRTAQNWRRRCLAANPAEPGS